MASAHKVWDPAVRLTHWSFALLVPAMWLTAENGIMDWHRRLGLLLLGLIVFRIYWGFAGPVTARFSQFVKGPGAIAAYLGKLKRPYTPSAGHNPLGALSVIALLAALLAQVCGGLFAVDIDGIESGYLSHLVSFETGRAAAELHEAGFNLLVGLIALHLGAIAFYFFAMKTNLIGPMLTGKREVGEAPPQAAMAFPLVRLMIGVVIAGLVVFAIQR